MSVPVGFPASLILFYIPEVKVHVSQLWLSYYFNVTSCENSSAPTNCCPHSKVKVLDMVIKDGAPISFLTCCGAAISPRDRINGSTGCTAPYSQYI